MDAGQLRRHWLGVLRHLYSNAWHGTAVSFPSWDVFLWRHFGRSQALALPRVHDPDLASLWRFLKGLGEPSTMIELDAQEDGHLVGDLEATGWRIGYNLPVHVIHYLEPLGLAEAGEEYHIELVTTPEGCLDFAYVQDRAYQASYDWPRGCAALFYTSPHSLLGPDTLGAVLYDSEGRPVRTAQIVQSHGLVSGIAGAAVPHVRGQHLGEALMECLRVEAHQRWGVSGVLHETMPVAMPIATRLKLPQVALFQRWTREAE